MADPYNNRFGYQQCSPSFPQTIPGFNPRTTQTVHGFNPGIPQTGFAFNSPQPWQWQHRQQQQYSGVSSPSSSYANNVNATAAHSRQRGSGDVIARADIIARAEHAATAAYTGFLSAGESVTVWELTQSVLSTLKADSLESLGLRVQDIPCLYKIILLEGKLNAFVHCYVAVRRIATLHDLSTEICRQEGVEDFERLGLGPLIRHPLIVHYFAPPADIVTAFKITTEQIISYLSDFLDDWQEKDIRVEEFLSFVSKKESVSFPAQLCIRIQSLRMHIGFLWRTKKVEKDLNRQVEAETEKKIDIERRKQVSAMQSKIISERLGSFLSSNKETTSSGHKHIRFETVSSSDNDEDPADRNTSVRLVPKRKLDHQCEKSGGRCPYPSAAEELARLGKQPSTDKERNCLNSFSDEDEDPGGKSQDMCRRKRRKVLQHEKSLVSRPCHSTAEEHVMLGKQVSTEKSKYAKDDVLLLKDNELKIFIAAWKDICREQSVYEVFTRMLELQWMANKKGNKKCTRKLFKLFTMQPAIGLLNVAVMSMKMGLWDSLYDTFQEVNKQDGRNTETAYVSGVIDVGISKAAAPVPSVKEEGDTLVSANGVSIGEVLQQVISFLERDSIEIIEAGELAMKEWFMTLRRIWDCEKWLMKQFSIRDFTVLGFGDFLDFLKDHISQIPDKIIKKLVVHNRENLSLTASIAKNQLLEFLSQATSENGENVLLTREEVNILLYKQFPSIRFELPDSYSFDEVLNYIRKLQNFSEQKKTRYSAALLARNSTSDHSSPSSAITEKWISEAVQIAGAFGHMTSADALKCLLKAPMLSDLEEWSHWDHIFAPTLGPILNWLDKEGSVNSLLCLVLRSGKVVRIDGSATMEGFLTAAVKCSAKKTAAQLVSIVSLYGGTRHAPVALMKSHACRAIDIMVKNCVDCFDSTTFMALDKTERCINSKRSQQREMNADGVSSHSSVLGKAHVVHDYNETAQKVERTNQAIRVAARFILNCLVCIPSEFRTFASHIFFSGLTALEADVSQVLLQECVAYDERVMLHEIGLSIGIVDWINDYQFFSLDAEHSSMSEECLDSKSTVQNDGQFDTKSNYGAHQLEGIHCPDFKRKEASLDELQSEHLDDQNVSQDMPKDCDNHIARSQALVIDRLMQVSEKGSQDEDGRRIIEAIRRDEFGLDLELECNESLLLKKQHARLSRALLCLSQELYSQDSHFLLELVQNADDNAYPANVEPTLAFILQTTGVMVLNNELGFTAENIRALCDVGNSTKKGSNAGYIGQKGIGFKSVFRVTDSPEIHSNGFHIKFDITEGELGFILPTPVPPLCNLELFSRDLASGNENLDCPVWNTCIVLPFKCSLVEGTGMRSWASKFADFHPSLLLFLHRLRCIKVRDSMTNSLTIMRREDIGNGLVKVSHGKESTTWLVASHKLDAGTMRPGIQSTEIAMAFTLRQDSSGEFVPYLEQQPVFAFLPLRAYGLKFILQGDFILPSSREEVDGDSAWNQWLLSEFPGLFVNAAESFRSLPCYQSNPGKAVSLYMSFVPLVGEVLGFFSPLPRMILSKLRVSPCLPLEGKDKRWVLPCMVLRGWNDQIRTLLPDDLLSSHLGVGYLHRDVSLSDPIAAALGVHTFGPRILIDLMKSVCNRGDDLKNLGSNWIGSWLVTLYECLNCRLTGYESCFQVNSESDFLNDLAQIPFIPLSDGSYTSIREDSIWLPCEATRSGVDGAHILKNFPKLYCELRTVHPSLFFSLAVGGDVVVRADSDVMVCMLRRAGIGQLSAHEVVMKHILQAMTNVECLTKDKLILAEYLAFIMVHLQSNCSLCHLERPKMIQELQVKAVIITNNGYRRAGSEPLHFSREFGNPVDMKKVLAGTNVVWNEIDSVYLQFASNEVRSLNMLQWRKFFTELGVTDLMQVVNIEKKLEDQSCSIWKDLAWEGNANSVGWTVNDWESPELVDILTALSSSSTYVDQCSHFLQVLDSVWDDLYGAKKATYCCGSPGVKEGKCTESSCVLKIREYCWVKSRLDGKLYIPSNLFFDCDEVRSILGSNAPYATPQVHSRKFVADIGFRTQVLVKDALSLLSEWSKSECMFKASTSQMGRLYSFLSTRMDTCRDEIVTHFRLNPSIFVPLMDDSNQESVTPGMFLLLDQVYWRDPTGCLDLLIKGTRSSTKIPVIDQMCCRALCEIYPNLHSFFVNDCRVQTSPDFDGYLRILKHLASIALPSKVYEEVMQVFYLWAEDIESQRVNCKEISRWKDSLHDSGNSVLPTMQDKWVSLHPKFGIVCWYDDADLGKQFEHCNGVHFLCIDAGGKHNKTKAKDGVQSKLITFIRTMGIPSLSEVVVREAIFYGVQDNKKLLSLINWILPYAQRYLYSMHPEVYCALKDNIFNNQLNQLRFLVVEELFYRHTLQGCHTVSNERHECTCLLQGSTLYVSRMADFSGIYSELSRLFFNGCVDLQLANFLHLITIMAESGSTEEQTESFILNAQTIPKLPLEELTWFCEHRGDEIDNHSKLSNRTFPENKLTTKKLQKISADASWPPTTWKGVPKSRDGVLAQAGNSGINQDFVRHEHNNVIGNSTVSKTNNACESDQVTDTYSGSAVTTIPYDSKSEQDMDTKRVKFGGDSDLTGNDNNFLGLSTTGLESADVSDKSYKLFAPNEMDMGTCNVFSNRNQLCLGVADDEQRQVTGRLGERVVYKYLSDKYGPTSVNWVNENGETGSAFDMVVSKEDGKKEFIEVKATRSENKDWFEITNREWDFASKNSDCFTIIRVFLGSSPYVKFVMLANPIKLYQQKIIKLAILMPINKNCALPEVTFIPQREGGD